METKERLRHEFWLLILSLYRVTIGFGIKILNNLQEVIEKAASRLQVWTFAFVTYLMIKKIVNITPESWLMFTVAAIGIGTYKSVQTKKIHSPDYCDLTKGKNL